MNRQLTYKELNILLLIGFLALSYIIYQRAKVSTIDLYTYCSTQEQELKKASISEVEVNALSDQLNALEKILGSKSGEENTQQMVLSEISQKNAIQLSEFQSTHRYVNNDYAVATNAFQINGKFKNCLSFLHELEIDFDYARVASVHFYTKKNWQQKVNQLYCEIYLQNANKN